MSTTAPRFIVVDDVDTSLIHYDGSWFPDQGSQDSVGNFGPAYQSTLHGANVNASFSFAFNGTQIKVLGSNNLLNTSGVLDPTWQCFIDNVSIGIPAPFAFQENNWLFCQESTLVDGPHVLTVNATVFKNQTFWFDDIQYVPSANVPLDQAAIMIDNLDPQIQYGQGWQDLGGVANMTLVNGSTFTFNFIGVSLSWYGFIPKELPLSPSLATFAIDGQTAIDFRLNGIPPNTTTVYNQKFFETPKYPPGPHTLKVWYRGNNSTPLVLDYLIVQNGTSSSTTSVSPHATATGNGVSGTSPQGKSSTPVGAIVGGVIGGLALIVFAVLGILFLRRRQKRTAQDEVFVSTPQPFDYTPLHLTSTAPNSSLSGGISYSQPPQTAQLGSPMTYTAKGHTAYHASMPSFSNTEGSQSIEPPSTSSGVTSANLRPDALQQAALTVANPSSVHSAPASASSVSSQPLLLPVSRKIERETLRPQRRVNPPSLPAQSNDDWSSPSVVLHADSGIRMPSNAVNRNIVDVPPEYTPD